MDLFYFDADGNRHFATPDDSVLEAYHGTTSKATPLAAKDAVTPYEFEFETPPTREIKARMVRRTEAGKRVVHKLIVTIPHALDRDSSLRAVASAVVGTMEREGKGALLHFQHHRWHSPQAPDLRHWLHSAWIALTCFKRYSGRLNAARILGTA